MCSNYIPASEISLRDHFGVEPPQAAFKLEAYPGYLAPIIRLPHDEPNADRFECVPACYGMVPHWADMKLARQTYNARTETVFSKPSFRTAWKKRQFCLIPADAFYEPCYETGKAVRWKIALAADRPFAMAGIWDWRPDGPDGKPLISFSMLTINADGHEVMQHFHKAEDEKRMVVILEPQQYQEWLHTPVDKAESFFKRYPAEQLVAVPAPKSPVIETKSLF
jgi:putative SOS response-associated peptidase YedK